MSRPTWYDYEKRGWQWAVGWSDNFGGYYAQAWRNLKKSRLVRGIRVTRECYIEGGKDIATAEELLWQRLDLVDKV